MRTFGLSLALIVGCGGDGGSDGNETGPCFPNQTCNEGLVCASEVCVDIAGSEAGTDGGTDGGEDNATPSGSGPAATTTSTTTSTTAATTVGDAAEIYCSVDDEQGDSCWCSHTPDWGFADQSCTPGIVGAPSLCCAALDEWPVNGTCQCNRMYCARDFDSCFCNTVAPDENEEPVDTCTAPSGGICCKDTALGWCNCWDDLTQCFFDDEVEVNSCSIASMDCGSGIEVAQCAG